MVGEFDEFGVQASDIAVLGGSEAREIGMDIKAEDGVFLSSALKTCDLGLQSKLRLSWPVRLVVLLLTGILRT